MSRDTKLAGALPCMALNRLLGAFQRLAGSSGAGLAGCACSADMASYARVPIGVILAAC